MFKVVQLILFFHSLQKQQSYSLTLIWPMCVLWVLICALIWLDSTLISNGRGNFCLGMCGYLQTHERTMKLPNANDVEVAEQSQGWTLDCPFIPWPVMPLIWHLNRTSTLRQLFVFEWACACRCVSCIISFCGMFYYTLCWTMILFGSFTTILWLSCPLKIIVSN